MARARKRSRRRSRKRAARAAPAVTVPVSAPAASAELEPAAPAVPSDASPASVATSPPVEEDAEARLLTLAREVAAIPRRTASPREAISATIDYLVEAWRPDAPLPAAVFAAWNSARRDDRAALALAFAREQVALGVREVVEAASRAGELRDD